MKLPQNAVVSAASVDVDEDHNGGIGDEEIDKPSKQQRDTHSRGGFEIEELPGHGEASMTPSELLDLKKRLRSVPDAPDEREWGPLRVRIYDRSLGEKMSDPDSEARK